MNREQATLRADQIKANAKAAQIAVEQAKAAEILPVTADQPVDAAVAEATKAVHQTRELHDHLLGQKLVAEIRKVEHVHTRKALAFSALTGDGSAKRRLDEVTAAEIAAGRDIENLNAAIATAVAKVNQAEAQLARAVERERAKEALSLTEQLGQHAAGFDIAVRQLLASYDALDRVCAALCAITGRPSRQSVRVAAKRCLLAGLTFDRGPFDMPAASCGVRDQSPARSLGAVRSHAALSFGTGTPRR
jgi:hypothetical protein